MPRFLVVILTLFTALFVTGVVDTNKENNNATCYNQTDFFKKIKDEQLVTLLKTETDGDHFLEVMISPLNKKEAVMVEYDKHTDDNLTEFNSKYCVLVSGTNSNINRDLVDTLYKALERLRGSNT